MCVCYMCVMWVEICVFIRVSSYTYVCMLCCVCVMWVEICVFIRVSSYTYVCMLYVCYVG